MRVVEAKDGRNPSLFAEKNLTESDTIQQQNRLLFHEDDVTNSIIPLLDEVESERANLQFHNHGMGEGLPVELYTINGWRFPLLLRRRPSGGLVLNGKDWKNVLVIGKLRAGDHVQLWSFRKLQDDALCLIIARLKTQRATFIAEGTSVSDSSSINTIEVAVMTLQEAYRGTGLLAYLLHEFSFG
ncbi:hypothetical protein J5N97_028057 [Dioscorea zingiberensis]|uniref:TF-B3 domain-containing protein n=1 Tax=Dioscorea zingiberensis TaxID=325984 RepID=A0A9D5BYF6_9LILI|nr:hypothetical protein J5N97_028057 [Dioscorea zingiberensis]